MSMEYFGISKKARETADAATTFDLVEPTPESGVPYKENTDKKGVLYKRWAEPVTFVRGSHEDTRVNNKNMVGVGDGKVPARQYYAQLRVGDTSKINKGRTIHARFNVDHEALNSGDPRSEWMNNKSIRAIVTLIEASGVKLPDGEVTEQIILGVFPKNNPTGATPNSIVAGKRVKAACVGSDRSDGKGRQVQIEEFLPEA